MTEPRAEWVPRRLPDNGFSRWLAQRPQRLLAWWTLLGIFVGAGIVLAVLGFPMWFAIALIVPGGVQLAADIVYIPRAVRASWRGHS